ncbi:MAG TPA: hypothetical protein IAD02_04740 [Candidatus Enterousia intestinigallinarum]|uniref:Porin n=1 Tax=Candidatus Enterousia intestinigallinarum TaxID=2840790 RepID=A0A9D1JX78_9PROT|nr:hypothetical protein [Candidatus Enterousia intestinigallinarum]
MIKYLSLFAAVAVLFGATPVMAATNSGTRAASSADLTGAPAVRERTQVNYEKYTTRTSTKTYDQADAANIYYTTPAKRSELYKQYDAGNGTATVRTTRAETYRTELRRKYYLAHPFFQPTKGKFGSVTDLSYNSNSYDLALTPAEGVALSDPNGKWDMSQFSIKEDFSYGITDRLAVLAMARFDMSDYKFDWALPQTPDDTMDDNGINLLGLGLQWRFVDTTDWIATASAYYQYQQDVSNNIVLDLKAGYKISSSTIYGLVRGWYLNFDGNSYGNGVTGKTAEGEDATFYLAYNTDADNTFYVEGGVGVFSVLDEDWTLNVEAILGNYDWHNQASLKAAIGWQPNDWFALNLYGRMAVWDSANGKDLSFWQTDTNPDSPYYTQLIRMGEANLDNYSDFSVGLQAIFMF